jgi:hypothetical protein
MSLNVHNKYNLLKFLIMKSLERVLKKYEEKEIYGGFGFIKKYEDAFNEDEYCSGSCTCQDDVPQSIFI